MEELTRSKEILISTGSGGVGKTTTAAAVAAMAAVEQEMKVLVLTVDPAKRLANALGMPRFGNREVEVPRSMFDEAGRRPKGVLFAAMLDTKQSWDDLINEHAPDRATANAILGNPLYENLTAKFVQSHDYVAMERLYSIHVSGDYDLVVVDTPPTRNAVDFLDAPERMADFFSSRLLRWLIAPYRSRMVSMASKPFYTVADRILGTQFLQDIADFFILFQTMYEGFVQRADAVARLLSDQVTSFLVVSTLEAAPAREAQFFLDLLNRRNLDVGALILNKELPRYFTDSDARRSAEYCREHAGELAATAAPLVGDPGDSMMYARMLGELGQSFLNFSTVAHREAAQRRVLGASAQSVVSVPFLETDVSDLSGLLTIGDALWDR